jgi:hypothetical protein
LIFTQKFEGQNLQYLKKGTANAQSLTLSFWVKSNKTGTYIAELKDQDNSRKYQNHTQFQQILGKKKLSLLLEIQLEL